MLVAHGVITEFYFSQVFAGTQGNADADKRWPFTPQAKSCGQTGHDQVRADRRSDTQQRAGFTCD